MEMETIFQISTANPKGSFLSIGEKVLGNIPGVKDGWLIHE